LVHRLEQGYALLPRRNQFIVCGLIALRRGQRPHLVDKSLLDIGVGSYFLPCGIRFVDSPRFLGGLQAHLAQLTLVLSFGQRLHSRWLWKRGSAQYQVDTAGGGHDDHRSAQSSNLGSRENAPEPAPRTSARTPRRLRVMAVPGEKKSESGDRSACDANYSSDRFWTHSHHLCGEPRLTRWYAKSLSGLGSSGPRI
jgi:hypothetical protein